MPGWLRWGLLALWALGLLVAMLAYSQTQLQLFDPAMTLSQAASGPTFDDDFVKLLEAEGVGPGSIVHLESSAGCYCNSLTAPHVRQLSAALDENYQLHRLSVDTAPRLQPLITTFPAVAVIDKQRRLRYLGPYASGYGCFTGKTLVEVIARTATAQSPLGAMVNTTAEGCFCSV